MAQVIQAKSIDATLEGADGKIAGLNAVIAPKGWRFERLKPPTQPVRRRGILGVVDSLVERVRGTPALYRYYEPNSFLCTPVEGEREDFNGAPYVTLRPSESSQPKLYSIEVITALSDGRFRLLRGIGFPEVVHAETLAAALNTGFNAPPKRANYDRDV